MARKTTKGNETPKTGFATPTEVARFFRVSKHSIYRMINAKELPAIEVGAQYRIPWEAVDKMATVT